jgi:guanylate kinase
MAVGRRGFALIISAPSGAGKTTLVNHVIATLPGVRDAISTTTRPPRPGEQDGVDYFFVTPEAFQVQMDAGAFLEWAEVFGNRYGTSRRFVEQTLQQGADVLLNIDWQGARQIRRQLPPSDCVSVFILPPGVAILRERLETRGQDDPKVIARRMAEAGQEAIHWDAFDYVIVNDDLPQAQASLVAIVQAERLRRERMRALVEPLIAQFPP